MIKSALVAAALAMSAGAALAANGAPSTIPHSIEGGMYQPVGSEKCGMCHKLQTPGQKLEKMQVPADHAENGKMAAMRENCTMCHAPAAPTEGKK